MLREPGSFFWGSAFPLLTVCLVAAGCSANRDQTGGLGSQSAISTMQVEVVAVERSNLSSTVELVGSLLPRRRTVIVAEVDGVIEDIPESTRNPTVIKVDGQQRTLPLDIGSEVAKGDLLIKLDASDYERGLRVAEAELSKAKAELAQLLAWQRPEEVRRAQALHDEALAGVERAEAEYERVKILRQRNAISESDFDERESQARRARALLAQAKASLDIAQTGPTKEEIAVANAIVAAAEADVNHKRWKVEKTSIVAPYDAVVTDRYVDVGDRVTALPRVEILELMDVSYLVAEVGVPERYSGSVRMMDRAVLRLGGIAEDVPGLVVRINDKIDFGSRTFRIRVAVDNAERRFRVGQFARVLLSVATSADVLTIPRQAITYSGGQPQVFVYAAERVHLTPVELGIASEESVEVISGLNDGDQVVVHDPAVLSDGIQVQLGPQSAARVTRRLD